MKARSFRIQIAACLVLAFSLPGFPAAAQEANPPLGGDFPASAFPENWEIRRSLRDGLTLAARETAIAWKGRTFTTSAYDVRVRTIVQGDYFYIVYENNRGGEYVTYSQGSWVVKRSKADGLLVQAKVFLRSDPGIFARIFPFKDRCKMEIILYGAVAYKDILLPVSFEDLLAQPFSKIMEYSGAWVDWGYLSPNLALYRAQAAMVDAIRSGIKNLEFAEDGALDENGRAVFIETGAPQGEKPGLNCSGFAKWIVDGLYAPIARERAVDGEEPASLLLPIGELKLKHPKLRGTSFTSPYEELRDPYFGLDWIRNLGRTLSDALYPGRANGPGDLDVSIHPFSQVTDVGEILNTREPYDPYPDFTPNVGYKASGLMPLLYKLAIKDPGAFYLAALSSDEGGRDPALTQYYHVAAIFPRFDSSGIFRISVFESCEETSLANIQKKRAWQSSEPFVFLVRMPSDSRLDYAAASGELLKAKE